MRSAAAIVVSFGLPAGCFGATVIDDFTTGALELDSPNSVYQDSLSRSSLIDGNRGVFANGSTPMHVSVNTATGAFSFQSLNWGYFTLTYAIDAGSEIDLLGDGSTAFRLTFADVTPGLWRGRYTFSVDGVIHHFAEDLFALNGPGVIEIPFSIFTSGQTFSPAEIELSAIRVEPGFQITISSIDTVPEPSVSVLVLSMTLFLIRRSRKTREDKRESSSFDRKGFQVFGGCRPLPLL